MSIWEILTPVSGGCTSVICSTEVADPSQLTAVIVSEAITLLEVVPSFLGTMPEYLQKDATSLRAVCVTGEAFPASTASAVDIALGAPTSIFNTYGPSEAVIVVSTHQYAQGEEVVPIGGPISNTEFAVFDARGNIATDHQGRLIILGQQVTYGYLHRQRQTSTAFIPTMQHGSVPAYDSGDIARVNRDGQLVFLGRKDSQVKIRGNRVEIGEVENAILASPSVDKCAVLAMKLGASESMSLVAFVQYVAGVVEENAVQDAVAGMPKSHHPSLVVPIESMPLNTSGKIDTNALKARHGSSSERQINLLPQNKHSQPSHSPNSQLARVVSTILGVESIDSNMSFFEAGGDSISAIKLVSAIKKEFPDAIFTVKDVFDYPTVEAMTSRLALGGPTMRPEIHESQVQEYTDDAVNFTPGKRTSLDLEKLRGVWRVVLKVESIDDEASFFAVGGDSISAIRLVSGVRAAFPDRGLSVKDVFDHSNIAQMARFLGLTRVRQASVAKARAAVPTKDVIDFFRNKARSSNSLEMVSTPSHEHLATEDMKWIRYSFTDIPVELNGVNRQSVTEAILRVWKHLLPATGEGEAVRWSTADGVGGSEAHPPGALSIAVVDDDRCVLTLLLSSLRFDVHTAEAFVNDFMTEVTRSHASDGVGQRLTGKSSRADSTSPSSRSHLPMNRQSVTFWRDVTVTAAAANVVSAKGLGSRSVESRDTKGAATFVAVRLPQLVSKESKTAIASWLVSSILLHAVSKLPSDNHHHGTGGISVSILVELPGEAGATNQVPLVVEASPKLVARSHFLVDRTMSKREYRQPQFEQLLYLERDFLLMASFEQLLRNDVAVCVARMSDSRLNMESRHSISFSLDAEGMFVASAGGNVGHESATLRYLSTVLDSLASLQFSLDKAPLIPFPVDVCEGSALAQQLHGAAIVDAWPLAPMQEGMLFEWLKDGGGTEAGSNLYVSQETRLMLVLHQSGQDASSHPSDNFPTYLSHVSTVRMAWQILTNRHEALRSVFVWDGAASPLQVVLRTHELAYSHATCCIGDASSCSINLDDVRFLKTLRGATQASNDEERAALDLSAALPPFRLRCIDLDHIGGVIVTTTWHHIILGGWSLDLLAAQESSIERRLSEGDNASNWLDGFEVPPLSNYFAWLGEQDAARARLDTRAAFTGFEPVDPCSPSTATVRHDDDASDQPLRRCLWQGC